MKANTESLQQMAEKAPLSCSEGRWRYLMDKSILSWEVLTNQTTTVHYLLFFHWIAFSTPWINLYINYVIVSV